MEQLGARLSGRELLIVLDNFEQLSTAAPQLIALLGEAPGVKLLVTSRSLLRVAGEHGFVVGPLGELDAVQLFAARARAANTAIDSGADVADVEEVCERLDRVPLALELAAARLRVLSVRELLERLDQRLAYLTGGPIDAPERHQSLRATLDWSYELLDARARDLFAAVSVFRGGFTLEAARRVCAPDGTPDAEVVDALGVLIDHSLLQRAADPSGVTRFHMLEVVRDFAAERLLASGILDGLSRRHASAFLELATRASAQLSGPEQSEWVACLEAETANIRAALGWALPDNEPEVGLELAVILARRFWGLTGRYEEGARWLTLALSVKTAGAGRARLRGLIALASMLAVRDPEVGSARADEAVELATALGDDALRARSTYVAALAYHDLDGPRSCVRFEQARELARRIGDSELVGWTLSGHANLVLARGEDHLAQRLASEALSIARAADDAGSILMSTCVVASTAAQLGEKPQALARIREAVDLARRIGGAASVPCLRTCGVILAHFGEAERAARLLGQAELLLETNRMRLDRGDVRMLDGAMEQLRAKLYPEVLHSAWERGRAMSLEDAYSEVLKELDEPSVNRPAD
jgi:predicted ATPase